MFNAEFPELYDIAQPFLFNPVSSSGGILQNGEHINCSYFDSVSLLVSKTAGDTNDVLVVALEQVDDRTTVTNIKNLPINHYYVKIGDNTGSFGQFSFSKIELSPANHTFTVADSDDHNVLLLINIKTASLDTNNGFVYVRPSLAIDTTTSTSASIHAFGQRKVQKYDDSDRLL